jgi:hypothetical protein
MTCPLRSSATFSCSSLSCCAASATPRKCSITIAAIDAIPAAAAAIGLPVRSPMLSASEPAESAAPARFWLALPLMPAPCRSPSPTWAPNRPISAKPKMCLSSFPTLFACSTDSLRLDPNFAASPAARPRPSPPTCLSASAASFACFWISPSPDTTGLMESETWRCCRAI